MAPRAAPPVRNRIAHAPFIGSQEKLEGIIQERYGIAWDETRKQIDSWYRSQGLE